MCPLKVRRFGFKLPQAFWKPAGCLPGLPSSSDYFFLLKLKVSPVTLSLLCFSKTLLDKLENTLTLHLFGLCLCQMWFCNYLSHDLHSTPEHSFAFQLSRLSARSVAYWCSSYSGRHNCPEAGIESYHYKLFSTHTHLHERLILSIVHSLICYAVYLCISQKFVKASWHAQISFLTCGTVPTFKHFPGNCHVWFGCDYDVGLCFLLGMSGFTGLVFYRTAVSVSRSGHLLCQL